MSTDALAFRESDSPWRRLYWTLPTALIFWTALVWALAYFVQSPGERLPEPPAIEAQVIELPPPAAPPSRTPPPVEKRLPPPPAAVKPLAPSLPVATPHVALSPEPVKPPPVAAPAVPSPSPAPPLRPATLLEKPARTSANFSGNSAAQAIVKPMPVIPDELREDALNVAALARFHVAADGTATVELARPTPNPRLNHLLLESLKHWRFFPAMKDSKPTASTEEIVIKVEVK